MFVRNLFRNLTPPLTNLNNVKKSTVVQMHRSISSKEEVNVVVERTKTLGSPGLSLDSDVYETHMSMFPNMVQQSLLRNVDETLNNVIKRFDSICGSSGPNREMYASHVLINAYKTLTRGKKLTLEDIKLACSLAWCFEMSSMGILLVDDMLDQADVRWKKPCLYKTVGAKVAVDIRLLHVSGCILLKKIFKDHPSYGLLLGLLNDCMYKTCIGQTADVNATAKFKQSRDLEMIAMKTYLTLVKYKTSYVMFKHPILAALYLHNNTDQTDYLNIINMLDRLSVHYQTMNDMWDCYGKYDTFGRYGTDIQEGQCTWLSAKAIECASKKQLESLRQNYGKEAHECQEVVRNIYQDIGIMEKYKQHKRKLWEDLNREMGTISNPDFRRLIQSIAVTYLDIEEDFVLSN